MAFCSLSPFHSTRLSSIIAPTFPNLNGAILFSLHGVLV